MSSPPADPAAAAPPPPGPVTYDVSKLVAYDYFGFWPSLALAATALSLYLLAALVIQAQNWRARNPAARFMWLVVLTGLTEAGGYASLVWLIQNSGKTNIYGGYVAMQVLVVLSPNLLQAAEYVAVGRVIAHSPAIAAGRRWLQPRMMAAAFVIADVVALCVQAIGISLWASSKGSGKPDQSVISLGSWITVGGLAFQLASFAVFTFLAVWVHRHPANRMRIDAEAEAEATVSHTATETGQTPSCRCCGLKRRCNPHARLFWGIYAVIVLVTIRNIFRFVEFVQGAMLTWPPPDSTFVLSESEVLFYTLDTLPIFMCFLVFAAANPAHLLPREAPTAEEASKGSDAGSSAGKGSDHV